MKDYGAPVGGVSVDVRRDGGTATVLIGGEIDTVTGPVVQDMLVELVTAPEIDLVMADLCEVASSAHAVSRC